MMHCTKNRHFRAGENTCSAFPALGEAMHTSKVIEVDGIFLGAAVMLPQSQGWRFVAADQRVVPLDGIVAETIEDTRRLARRAYQSSTPAFPATAKPARGR